jgi:hypothetical protein
VATQDQARRPFNPVVKLNEEHKSSMSEMQYDGSRVQTEIITALYRCEGRILDQKCMLVWDRFKHAVGCGERGHRNQFKDYYYTQTQTSDGLPPETHETVYVRQAVRRDGVRPAGLQNPVKTPAQAPEPAPVAQAPALSLADIRALALEHGFRLSKVPARKQGPEAEVSDSESDIPAF